MSRDVMWLTRRLSARVRRRLRTSRQDLILAGLDVANAIGVEIGPLDRPLVPRNAGRVFYADHASAASLREKYKNDPAVNVDNIQEVDIVCKDATLSDALKDKVDYVVASHVIEHVPDLIGWLDDIRRILKPEGSLRLAIPDRRYTFDYLRRETDLAELIDAHLQRPTKPLPRMMLDFLLHYRVVDMYDAWGGPISVRSLGPVPNPADVIATVKDAIKNGTYIDIHCSVFTPRSFVDLFAEAASIGLIKYRCDRFVTTRRYDLEFFVHLSPCEDTDEIAKSWRMARRKA